MVITNTSPNWNESKRGTIENKSISSLVKSRKSPEKRKLNAREKKTIEERRKMKGF